jgi:hypothetical protein
MDALVEGQGFAFKSHQGTRKQSNNATITERQPHSRAINSRSGGSDSAREMSTDESSDQKLGQTAEEEATARRLACCSPFCLFSFHVGTD